MHQCVVFSMKTNRTLHTQYLINSIETTINSVVVALSGVVYGMLFLATELHLLQEMHMKYWMYLNISIRFESYRQISHISCEQDSDENLGD